MSLEVVMKYFMPILIKHDDNNIILTRDVENSGVAIKLGTDCYTESGDEYWCEGCGAKEMAKSLRRTKG